MKRSAINLDVTPNADGFSIAGGTTSRTLTVTGGNITLTGGATTKGDILASDGTEFDIVGVGTNGQVLTADSAETNGVKWATVSGTGDVVGPASAVNNAPARFDTTTGKLIQSTANVTINDTGYYLVGGADGSAMVDLRVATDTLQGLRVEGDATDAISFSTYITADSFLRFSFLANGQMTWGSGSGAGDTNLYRSAANTLRTDDLMVASSGFQPAANDGAALGVSGTAFSDLFLASGAVINFNAGNYTITHSAGLLTLNGALSIGTGNALTAGTIELGAASDTTISRSSAGVIAVEGVTIPSISSTNTLTNKRITARTGTTTSSATPTINTDNVDYYSITAQTTDITSMSTNLSGTPTTAQQLRIDITGTAARAITWGASFANGPVALPTTTVTTTRLYVLLEYDGTIWRCMASGSTV